MKNKFMLTTALFVCLNAHATTQNQSLDELRNRVNKVFDIMEQNPGNNSEYMKSFLDVCEDIEKGLSPQNEKPVNFDNAPKIAGASHANQMIETIDSIICQNGNVDIDPDNFYSIFAGINLEYTNDTNVINAYMKKLREAINHFKQKVNETNPKDKESILKWVNKSEQALNNGNDSNYVKAVNSFNALKDALNSYIFFNADIYNVIRYILGPVLKSSIYPVGTFINEDFVTVSPILNSLTNYLKNYPQEGVRYVQNENSSMPGDTWNIVYNNHGKLLPVPFKLIFKKLIERGDFSWLYPAEKARLDAFINSLWY